MERLLRDLEYLATLAAIRDHDYKYPWSLFSVSSRT